MPLKVAVPKESASGERRVAIDPTVAKRLVSMGVEVLVEAGAGEAAGFSDSDYGDVSIVDAKSVYKGADIVCRVQAPSSSEVAQIGEGAVLIGTLTPFKNPETIGSLAARNITSFAMEMIPRISRAQAMDVLSSQAAVAGYKAAIMGSDLAPRFFPMLTTAAGTIRPSKVIVIGAGVAGLQAIATARRLGAIVEGYDVRSATKEQVESLGAKFIELSITAEGEGGYARELTDEEKQQQQEELADFIAKADVLITTAAIPGRPSPKIIPDSTVEKMKRGAVIIDLAAEGGGNCTLTQPGETIVHQGVTIHAPLNVPSQVPFHASEMYAKNLLNFMSLFIKDGEIEMDLEDEVIAGALLTKDGDITNDAVKDAAKGA
ncbi:MAG: Re/Si-specific NAD(P)(+) transhydrogenase subunit alpha [bacterium]